MSGKESNRSGVALIIVLGLVAILMIISVAFAIHMRVERAGAANLRHAAVARQIVKGGMAAAIAAIDQDVKNAIVAPWYDTNNVESLVYKRRDSWKNEDGDWVKRTTNFWKSTFVAYDTNALEHVTAHFPTEVDAYLPAGLQYRSFANRYCPPGDTAGGTAIIQPEWLPVYADLNNSSVIGRYSYFVLDTTGMLDANAEYGSVSTRAMGRETKEIQLLPKIKNLSGRYLSIADMDQSSAPDNIWWNTFSYTPTNALVYIGGDAKSLQDNKWEIIEAFYDSGLTASSKSFSKPQGKSKASEQACWAYLGLVDYVDDDYEMEYDSDLRIKPCERPATERMPLVSGFFARLTIKARQVCPYVSDGNYNLNAKVEVKCSADVKVPFVFPFISDGIDSFDDKDDKNLALEGKATLWVSTGGGTKFSKVEDKRIKPSSVDECIVQTIEVNKGEDDGWVNVLGNNDTRPVAQQLQLPDVEAYVQVGGATYRNNSLQHSYPVGDENYKDFAENYGMVVSFKPDAEGVSFDESEGGQKPNPDGEGNYPEKWTRSWSTNVLVWAEIVDPRFANKDMRENAEELGGDLVTACFKASHSIDGIMGAPDSHGIPLVKLKQQKPALFGGFDDPEKIVKEKVDDAFGKTGASNFDYGHYFDSHYNTLVGAGPFTSYLLTHPKAVEDFYGMPMDGIQKGASSTETDPAWAKWRMFVRNGRLESVGELGYLPIGFWQTIRLYDYGDDFDGRSNSTETYEGLTKFNVLPTDPRDNSSDPLRRLYPNLHKSANDKHDGGYFHSVLEFFSVVDESADEIVNGRINLNAAPKDILASAFHKMPIDKPDGLTRGSLNEENANLLAESIIESRNNNGTFCGLSELGYLFEEPDGEVGPLNGTVSYPIKAVKNTAGSADWGEWVRESMIRNSCGLFTTRGQSYLIIVRGESYSPRFGHKRSMVGGNSNASKTAIAQIWRDTIPDKNGKHPIFVKFFKIIDD